MTILIGKVPPVNGRSKQWLWGVTVNGDSVAETKTRARAEAIAAFIKAHPELDVNTTNFEDLVP